MRKELLSELRRMTEEEVFDAIYCDPLTHVLNRRAFKPDKERSIAIIDIDSLKYINDTYGHQAGDVYLCQLAQALTLYFGSEKVYRLNGDEFAVTGEDGVLLRQTLINIRDNIFPGFSFGIGKDIATADMWLGKDKLLRETSGKRSARGLAPPWIKEKFKNEFNQS